MKGEKEYKHYIVYETTNLLNGKTYIGVHRSNHLEDDYLGSGTHLKRSIRKYGKHNFSRKTLFIFDNEKDMLDKEIELVDCNCVTDAMTYNKTAGGRGSFSHIDTSGDKNPMKNPEVAYKVSMSLKGRTFSDEHRLNLSLAHIGDRNHLYGKKRDPLIGIKISEALKGKKASEETKKKQSEAHRNRKPDSEETRKKKSEAAIKNWRKRKQLS